MGRQGYDTHIFSYLLVSAKTHEEVTQKAGKNGYLCGEGGVKQIRERSEISQGVPLLYCWLKYIFKIKSK